MDICPREFELPEGARFEEVSEPPLLSMRVRISKSFYYPNRLFACVAFDYAGHEIASTDTRSVVADAKTRRLARRDRGAEAAAFAAAHAAGFRPAPAPRPDGDPADFTIAKGKFSAAVRALVSVGWRIEAEGKLYRSASHFRLEVASGIDWFELRGGADYGGEIVPLPALPGGGWSRRQGPSGAADREDGASSEFHFF